MAYGINMKLIILILHKDVSVKPNSNEINNIYYVQKKKVDTYLSGLSSLITPWFNFVIKSKRLNQWWNNLHQLNKLTEHDKTRQI